MSISDQIKKLNERATQPSGGTPSGTTRYEGDPIESIRQHSKHLEFFTKKSELEQVMADNTQYTTELVELMLENKKLEKQILDQKINAEALKTQLKKAELEAEQVKAQYMEQQLEQLNEDADKLPELEQDAGNDTEVASQDTDVEHTPTESTDTPTEQ